MRGNHQGRGARARWTLVVLTLVVGGGALAALAGPAASHHVPRIDERIVHPYNVQVFYHVPVVAGYEPVPAPLPCVHVGERSPVAVYSEDFEGAHGWTVVDTPLAAGTSAEGNNLWHVTDHDDYGIVGDQGQHLYFGHDETGNYLGPGHVAGVAQSPWFGLPLGPSVLGFATKWEVESLTGYDHMFVEMEASDGTVHLLCQTAPPARADRAGVNGGSAYASCSPYPVNPCPNRVPTLNNAPTYEEVGPAWEFRQVQVPQVLWGDDVRIRFTFDSSDGAANWWMGWMVDDVQVVGVGLS